MRPSKRWVQPALAMGVAVTACGLLGAEDDGCYAGEFPARCAIIEGVVSDSSGSPLAGITVGPRYIVDDCCTTTYATTSDSGRYSFRIARPVLFEEGEDTLTLFVGAARLGEGWIDSVQAFVTFDAPPVIHRIDLVLPR